MTYEPFIACPAVGWEGVNRVEPKDYAGPLLDCSAGHERVTWRGQEGEACWCCGDPGRMVGYPSI